MFSLLQRGFGEEYVVALVLGSAGVEPDVATVALFWRGCGVLVRLHGLSGYSCLSDISSRISLIVVKHIRVSNRIVVLYVHFNGARCCCFATDAHANGRDGGLFHAFTSHTILEEDHDAQEKLFLPLLRCSQAIPFSQTAQPAPDVRSTVAPYSFARDLGTPCLARASRSFKQSRFLCNILLQAFIQQ